MLTLQPIPDAPTPTEIQRLAERLAFSIAPYPSERGSVAKLLIAFADEIIIDSMRLMSNRLQPTTSRLISNPTKGTQNE